MCNFSCSILDNDPASLGLGKQKERSKEHVKEILKNFSYTFVSNVVSFCISALVTFIVPKKLGVESYGYFQLYLFYVSYVGFFHFGWADGVFLRYGGAYYDQLDRAKFSAQFWLYSAFELTLGAVIGISAWFYARPEEKALVLCLVGVAVFLLLPRTFLQYVLQCTNRMREYAFLTVIEKIVYFVLVLVFLLGETRQFAFLIAADLFGKSCALVYAAYQCRDIILTRMDPLEKALEEVKQNISVGSKLMISNIAGMLIIGIVRLSIEHQWDVATFGKISLTMSVSNMLMVVIRAVAMVTFPMLRRTDNEKLAPLYNTMRVCLMIPLLGMMVAYYPVKAILSVWLPQYAESLRYMAILFPMCIFESKMSMLIETYLKALRKERWLLLVNVVTVSVSLLVTISTVFLLQNLNLAILSIVMILAFRCVVAELLLSKVLDVTVIKDIVLELLLTTIFVAFNWFGGGTIGLLAYLLSYLVYLFLKRNELRAIWDRVFLKKQ